MGWKQSNAFQRECSMLEGGGENVSEKQLVRGSRALPIKLEPSWQRCPKGNLQTKGVLNATHGSFHTEVWLIEITGPRTEGAIMI